MIMPGCRQRRCFFLVQVTLLISCWLATRADGTAATAAAFKPPPMGFSSWNKFGMGITVPELVEVAEAFASRGLQAAGYLYMCSDDGWMELNRSSDTDLQVPTAAYMNGTYTTLRSVCDALHARGFKCGIYTAAGTTTCGVRAGSLYNERLDAAHYAASGVDYIKYDGCGEANLQHYAKDSAMYNAVRQAYASTPKGAIDYFSYHPWKTYVPQAIHEMPWVATVGDLWRTTLDIRPTFSSILNTLYGNNRWAVHQRPGHYNDADMLEVGNGQLTLAEQRSHFALWCLMKSPLLIGADVRSLPDASLAILTNRRLIAINQDELGVQGTLRSTSGSASNSAGAAQPRGSLDESTATSHASSGSQWVAPCTFGAQVVARQQWQASDDGRLRSTHDRNKCLVRSSADDLAESDSRLEVLVSEDCATGSSRWDFGRANVTLSQIRAQDNTSACLTYDGVSLHTEQCRAETSDTPKPGKDCTLTTCRFSSRSDQLWYLNSQTSQLSSSFTNWAAPIGSPARVAAMNIPMCLVSSGGMQPKPTPAPALPAMNHSSPHQVWAGPLAGGDVVVMLFNAGNVSDAFITASWTELGLRTGAPVTATNLWSGEVVSNTLTGNISAHVGAHDVAAFRLSAAA
jgi:alpha-galactosidase